MPIFVSYSHADSDFVDRLANQLVAHRVSVWMDRWELSVGDSLLTRVQEAITGSSALLVVLSRASVSSEWVTKEVNAGLLRELEEKQTVVLPILLEDCAVPIFLRDKYYADFRTSFDDGLQRVLESVARISTASMGRIDTPDYNTDWGLEWGLVNDCAAIRVTLIEHATGMPFSVLAEVSIQLDQSATAAHLSLAHTSGEDLANLRLLDDVSNGIAEVTFRLGDELGQAVSYTLATGSGLAEIRISARRLGTDTGRDVLYRASDQVREMVVRMSEVLRAED